MNKDLSAKIKVLSFLAAIFVVLIHVGGQLDCDVWVNRVYLIFVRQGIYSFAVPFFFVVSGYFFMNHYDGSLEWWRVALLKKELNPC